MDSASKEIKLNVTIKSNGTEMVISTLGAEPQSLKRDGIEYIWQGDEKFWAKQCPVLFPICGRLHKKTYRYNGKVYKMEPHGFASRSDFKAEKISDTEMAFTLKENEETLAQYTFRLTRAACTPTGTSTRRENRPLVLAPSGRSSAVI